MYNQQCCKSSENKMELKYVPSSSSKIELKYDPSSAAKLELKSVQDPLILKLVPILVTHFSNFFLQRWRLRKKGGFLEGVGGGGREGQPSKRSDVLI